MEALRLDGEVCYLDKILPCFGVSAALAHGKLGEKEAAGEALRRTKELAVHFDAAPCSTAGGIRFLTEKKGTAYDDLGSTALDGVETMVAAQHSEELSALWEQIRAEG